MPVLGMMAYIRSLGASFGPGPRLTPESRYRVSRPSRASAPRAWGVVS